MNKLKFEELQEINGGGWKEAGAAFAGTVGIGVSPLVCAASGPYGCVDWVSTNWDMIKDASNNAYKKKRK